MNLLVLGTGTVADVNTIYDQGNSKILNDIQNGLANTWSWYQQ